MRGALLGDLPQASGPSCVPHYPRLIQEPVSLWLCMQGLHCVFVLALIMPIFSPQNPVIELHITCLLLLCFRK